MAAATLLARHHDSIFGLAMRMMRNRQEAEDITQETMVRALSKIDDYDPSRPFSPWIHRIARNLCVDRFRRKKPTSESDFSFRISTPTASVRLDPGSRTAFEQWEEGLMMCISAASPLASR